MSSYSFHILLVMAAIDFERKIEATRDRLNGKCERQQHIFIEGLIVYETDNSPSNIRYHYSAITFSVHTVSQKLFHNVNSPFPGDFCRYRANTATVIKLWPQLLAVQLPGDQYAIDFGPCHHHQIQSHSIAETKRGWFLKNWPTLNRPCRIKWMATKGHQHFHHHHPFG